jgi:uncharacterized protein YndB with AHSA1/START domain
VLDYEVCIKATPQAVWDAITSPEWTVKYGYQGAVVEYELRPGGAYRAHATPEMQAMGVPDVVIDGVVEEANPPRKLVHTYRFLFQRSHEGRGLHARHVGNRAGRHRLLEAHRDPRA